MAISDAQVRKLMSELNMGVGIGKAALRVGIDRKTARKYRDLKRLPSECRRPRTWRTRRDPFAEDWPVVVELLEEAPELAAKTIFEYLQRRSPGRYAEGQLRTLQRRIQRWRAQSGPSKEVFFAQKHRPGEAAQTDFTEASELGVTINGEPFKHWLCQVVLPYSNWQWATVCLSESFQSLKRGIQSALFQLGAVPEFHQTDNSTAATHVARGEAGRLVELHGAPGRKFNEAYLKIMEHFCMTPRTTAIGAKEQNGDVESLNGALKRRLKQHLLLRGSHDFKSQEAYERWIWKILRQANQHRTKRLGEELAVMKPLPKDRLPEFTTRQARVTRWSLIRVLGNSYSVPSRLIGEKVEVRVYSERLEVWFCGQKELEIPRLVGSKKARVNYRHVIDSLVKKPGAFPRYRYREDFFPNSWFRRAYDRLHEKLPAWPADLNYLRVLQLAAQTSEDDVEVALELLLTDSRLPTYEQVLSLIGRSEPEIPEQRPLQVDLTGYDSLLGELSALEEVA